MRILDPREWRDLPETTRVFWWEWWVTKYGLRIKEGEGGG
jgi:hypothetical protein